MAKILSSRRATDVLTIAALIAAIGSLLLYPSEAVEAARSGVELCANVIIPSLFPFFVLSALCVELGLIQGLGRLLEPVMKPLFRLNGSCAAAFALGIIGGYPVGAKTAISLYEKHYCTRDEAERMLAFCNNSGPAFILGVVGAGVFASSKIGLMLYLIHIAASVIVGVLFRFRGRGKVGTGRVERAGKRTPFFTAFPTVVRDSFQSALNICAFVIFFTVVIRILFLSGAMSAAASALSAILRPFGMTQAWAEKLLIGAIEMSSGVWSLQSAAGTLTGRLSMAAFILGWAGVSVHCQVLSFIGGSGLSTKPYLIGKLLHGVISAALVAVVSRFVPFTTTASGYYAEQITAIAGADFMTSLRTSMLIAGVLFLLLAAASLQKKRWLEKREQV